MNSRRVVCAVVLIFNDGWLGEHVSADPLAPPPAGCEGGSRNPVEPRYIRKNFREEDQGCRPASTLRACLWGRRRTLSQLSDRARRLAIAFHFHRTQWACLACSMTCLGAGIPKRIPRRRAGSRASRLAVGPLFRLPLVCASLAGPSIIPTSRRSSFRRAWASASQARGDDGANKEAASRRCAASA